MQQDPELVHRTTLILLLEMVAMLVAIGYSWWQARRYHKAIGYSPGMAILKASELWLGVTWFVFIIGATIPPPYNPLPLDHPVRVLIWVGGPLYKIIVQVIRGRGWKKSTEDVLNIRRLNPLRRRR